VTTDPHGAVVFTVGVISDTHGELSDAAAEALTGVDAIVHAGDLGGSDVLDLLEAIAPVTLVRGNDREDTSEWRRPFVADVVLGGVRFVVAHYVAQLAETLAEPPERATVAVSGHTHVGSVEERDGFVLVNPGSPTRSYMGAPLSVARVTLAADGRIAARIIEL
jgi:putative phosphoesterase